MSSDFSDCCMVSFLCYRYVAAVNSIERQMVTSCSSVFILTFALLQFSSGDMVLAEPSHLSQGPFHSLKHRQLSFIEKSLADFKSLHPCSISIAPLLGVQQQNCERWGLCHWRLLFSLFCPDFLFGGCLLIGVWCSHTVSAQGPHVWVFHVVFSISF